MRRSLIRSFALLIPTSFYILVSGSGLNEAQCRSIIVYEKFTPKITVVLDDLVSVYEPIIPAKLAGVVKTRVAYIPVVPRTPIDPVALSAIEEFEKFHPKAYYCPGGRLTIGYGLTKDDIPDLSPGDTISEPEAERILCRVIEEKYLPALRTLITTDLTQEQEGALVSFAFNVGIPAFERSTLRAFLNAGKIRAAADEFGEWTTVHKRRLLGLVRRRAKERELFLRKSS